MKKIRLVYLLFFVSVLTANAQTDALRKKHINHINGLAISGYDPVAYFTESRAIKGKPEFQVTHKGITYYFSSVKHKELFLVKPNSYEPEYGGWCAFAMGDYGQKVKIDPETFKITNGKLYLFYNFLFNNTLTSWNKNETNLIKLGNYNWSKINQ